MSTINYMHEDHLHVAETYYRHMLDKNFKAIAACLHPEVRLKSPLAQIFGKENVVLAAKSFSALLKKMNIRAKFQNEHQVMLAYDFTFPDPIGEERGATLMHFKGGLISEIELFYDARPLEKKKDEIFSQK